MALTRTQSQRLATILAVMSNDPVPYALANDALSGGFIEEGGSGLRLTEKGLDEKNRLCALAGLSIKYAFEKTTPEGVGKTEVIK